jgi:hypothetical protein
MPSRTILAALCVFASSACAADGSDSLGEVTFGPLAFIQTPVDGIALPMPDDVELEHRGARIGRVDIEVADVFETGIRIARPYRLANALHVSTKQATVADQLLFHSGDPYRAQALQETARMLRAQRYLGEADVRPIRYNNDNTVDVMVRVHDVWTLSPGFSFKRKGGENSTRLEFEDTNFLGLGKQISAERASDVDRAAWRFQYVDPNLFGTWWRLSTTHADFSDGAENAFALSRPFYALDTRWSFNAAAVDSQQIESLYALGHVADQFSMSRREREVGGGISSGLRDGMAIRYLGGFRYQAREFAPVPGRTLGEAPLDRTFAYPWAGVEIVEDAYRTTRNLDQIGRTEDLYLGRSARLELGLSSAAFGATDDAVMLSGALQSGAELAGQRYLINALGFTGRIQGGRLSNAVLDLSSRYYLRQSPRRVFFASASTSIAARLDPEEQLLLGGDNGLRGYPLRYQAGTSRALFTAEERFYTDWQPLKLFNVGAAVFFDAGRTWGRDAVAQPSQGWLKDVGVGLRLGSVRSGLGNVLHVDVAYPLDARADVDGVQLLIETRRSF